MRSKISSKLVFASCVWYSDRAHYELCVWYITAVLTLPAHRIQHKRSAIFVIVFHLSTCPIHTNAAQQYATHTAWICTKLWVSASFPLHIIGVSHTACKDEFRQNLRFHSWSVFSFFIVLFFRKVVFPRDAINIIHFYQVSRRPLCSSKWISSSILNTV